jgi:hypothetical protein
LRLPSFFTFAPLREKAVHAKAQKKKNQSRKGLSLGFQTVSEY